MSIYSTTVNCTYHDSKHFSEGTIEKKEDYSCIPCWGSAKFNEGTSAHRFWPYKKLGYVFYTFCIRFVYVFKKSMVFIRNWSIFRINYTFLILRFLYVFKNLIKNLELKTYNLYGILTNSL